MNLVLIGFTSCGKSAAGKELARRLDYSFVDLDSEIIKLDPQQRSCRDIFKQDGEGAFRNLENKALCTCSQLENSIISTGGGTPLYEKNQKILTQIGPIVWIQASAQILFDRMHISKGLPAFLHKDPTVSHLKTVLDTRIPAYSLIADTSIDTDSLTIDEVADTLFTLYFST